MMDLYPYLPDSLGEMFNLRKGDIHTLIETEGIPIFSPSREEFIGYLPTLRSAFKLNAVNVEHCAKNIDPTLFNIELKDSLLMITSSNIRQPPSSLLFNNLWIEPANQILDIFNENMYMLVSNRINSPIFCGHKDIIERLAINFNGDIKSSRTKDFIKECIENG